MVKHNYLPGQTGIGPFGPMNITWTDPRSNGPSDLDQGIHLAQDFGLKALTLIDAHGSKFDHSKYLMLYFVGFLRTRFFSVFFFFFFNLFCHGGHLSNAM